MTAIALLNADNEPYIVSDSLITAEGPDPDKNKSVWLPAQGQIKSEWIEVDQPDANTIKIFHITRLGRKCFTLPDNTGILAFADSCEAAYSFWDKLSDKINTNKSYDNLSRPSLNTLHDTISGLGNDAHKFSLLGILIDENSRRVPFIHNPTIQLTTKNFGTCYICGTGASQLAEIIKAKDQAITAELRSKKISITEDLAEHISAEMLYQESDISNGYDKETPLAAFCGGFYEWHKIDPVGVRTMPSRVDLHFLILEGKLILSRIYLIEQMQTLGKTALERYATSVITLGCKFFEVPKDVPYNEYSKFVSDEHENIGVFIKSTFSLYDEDKKNKTPKRLSGKTNSDTLRHLFPTPLQIDRTRIIIGNNEDTSISSRWHAEECGFIPITIKLIDDQLVVHISNNLINYAWKAVQRLNQ
ncbi:hypothetical protein [Pseudomonas fluorescens]|uniref:Uncharacterized protein n=1 Tax=Pseudomonas fluorescens TaxID=294 RepID=A0A0F4V6R7_PSEFL|nr:hypothetical protein [Pseudomonas fluorescens]KJZ63652.1 hypothetical protein VD17_21975 [Pseudomonas fluorescens]